MQYMLLVYDTARRVADPDRRGDGQGLRASTPPSPRTRRRSTAPSSRAPKRRRPSGSRTARRSSRTARSPRRRRRSAATTSSRRARSRRRRSSPSRSRPRASAAPWRSGRSWRCSGAVHAAHLRQRHRMGARGQTTTCARSCEGYGRLNTDLARGREARRCRRLRPVRTATSVRIRNGETIVTDGPFAETKDSPRWLLSLEAENLDEAIAGLARSPPLKGTIEVRPVVDHSGSSE